MNSNEISVDDAIKKGKLWVINPSFSLFALIIVIGFYLSFILNDYPNYIMFFIILVGLLFLLLYRSISLPKWKIWAFGNVRNVHELERKAKYYGILNKPNSFFEKVEFFSNNDKLKWEAIQQKFSTKDIFIDKKETPKEVQFFKSKIKIILRIILYLICLICSSLLLIFSEVGWYFSLLGLLLFIWFLYGEIQDLIKSNSPFLTLNDDGIKIQDGKFYEWSEIKNDRMYLTTGNRSATYWLSFDTNSGKENLLINDLKNRDNLFDDLLIFRNRYNEKK